MRNQLFMPTHYTPFLFIFFLSLSVRTQGQPDDIGIGAPENVGIGVNTEWAEILPVVSPDGKRLYFSRKEAPENRGGEEDLEDIYYSEIQPDGSWGPAVNAGASLNSAGSDLLFSFSSDGNAALVYSGKKINGKETGLAISRKKNGRWQRPEPISIEGLDDLGDYYYAHMSGDGKHLFVSYAPGDDPLNLDIFYSEAMSDDMMIWGEPIQIPGMNTRFIEGSPFLSTDQRTLYLISDRPGGSGLGDVYVMRRTGDDWYNWTFPEELRGHLNTGMFESSVSVSPDGKSIYISRLSQAQPPLGRLDVFKHSLPESILLAGSYELNGRLVDKKTGEGIPGEISVSPQREDKIVAVKKTRNDGMFSVVLLPGIMITLRAKAPGYRAGGLTFDARRLDLSAEIPSVTIELDKDDTKPVRVPTVYFTTGSASISRESQGKLRNFAAWLNEFPQMIEIFGHTDSVGTSENNMRLGEQRAEAVKDYLIALNVPVNSMVVRSYGETKPVETDGTARGRAANRRVEINVPGVGEISIPEREPANLQRGQHSPTKRSRKSPK